MSYVTIKSLVTDTGICPAEHCIREIQSLAEGVKSHLTVKFVLKIINVLWCLKDIFSALYHQSPSPSPLK